MSKYLDNINFMKRKGGNRSYKKRRKRKTRKKKKKRKRNKTRRKRNNKTYRGSHKKDKCAPKLGKDKLPFTCYTKNSLFKLKEIWNIKHPDMIIKSNKPREIWESLNYILGKTCNRESCWLKHKTLSENIPLDIKKNTFAPKRPEEWKLKPDEWLSSIEILEVMKQYEKIYPCFDFIGPSPIDYDKHVAYGECVWEELCEFNLEKTMSDGKRKIGVIFNLDPHDKPGSHWVALFINTDKKRIYYLDSYGEKIPSKINKFANKVKKQADVLGLGKYELLVNKRRHQFSESECGMYSLYFIIEMLKGRCFEKFTKQRIKDDFMKKLRKIYFNDV